MKLARKFNLREYTENVSVRTAQGMQLLPIGALLDKKAAFCVKLKTSLETSRQKICRFLLYLLTVDFFVTHDTFGAHSRGFKIQGTSLQLLHASSCAVAHCNTAQ